jgi:hypothetical protein
LWGCPEFSFEFLSIGIPRLVLSAETSLMLCHQGDHTPDVVTLGLAAPTRGVADLPLRALPSVLSTLTGSPVLTLSLSARSFASITCSQKDRRQSDPDDPRELPLSMLPRLCLLSPLSAAFFWVFPTPDKTPVYAAPSLPLADNDDRWMLSPSLYATGIPQTPRAR